MKNIIKPIKKSQFNTKNIIKNEKPINEIKSKDNYIILSSLDLINLFINYKIPVSKETINKICEITNFIIKK